MGLLNSIVGWFWHTESKLPLSSNKIVCSAKRMVFSLKNKQYNLQEQTKKLQAQLVKMIKGRTDCRSAEAENTIIAQIILNSQKSAAYEQLISLANIVHQNANQLEKDSSKVSNRCFLAICSIIYAFEPMNLSDIIPLKEFLPQPYPKVSIGSISQPLQTYLSPHEPSAYDKNIYILQMIQRHKIPLELINQAGHEFVSNPHQLTQHYESKSSQLFALDFQDFLQQQAMQQAARNQKLQIMRAQMQAHPDENQKDIYDDYAI